MSDNKQYWFPATRYGWGWGAPITWQGWAVTIAFGWLGVGGYFPFRPYLAGAGFLAYCIALTAGFVAVCWLKGAPPRWRWGGK